MKLVLISFFVALLWNAESNCSSAKAPRCLKGKLEIKGICSNYTIRLIEGSLDTSKIAAEWTDENTGKSYKNVFALDSPCSFPDDIKEGDEFFFSLRADKDKDCNVCMAFYPTPPKRLSISVSKTACP